jgi:1,4-alpha-glucan branching enzyme
MNSILDSNHQAIRSRHSARNTIKPMNFYYPNRNAKTVRLIGDFNAWNQDVHPMRRREDGCWFVEVPLTHGHHCYQLLVDGVPTLDPHSSGTAVVEPFGKVSIIAVS